MDRFTGILANSARSRRLLVIVIGYPSSVRVAWFTGNSIPRWTARFVRAVSTRSSMRSMLATETRENCVETIAWVSFYEIELHLAGASLCAVSASRNIAAASGRQTRGGHRVRF